MRLLNLILFVLAAHAKKIMQMKELDEEKHYVVLAESKDHEKSSVFQQMLVIFSQLREQLSETNDAIKFVILDHSLSRAEFKESELPFLGSYRKYDNDDDEKTFIRYKGDLNFQDFEEFVIEAAVNQRIMTVRSLQELFQLKERVPQNAVVYAFFKSLNTAPEVQRKFVQISLKYPELTFLMSYSDIRALADRSFTSLQKMKERLQIPAEAFPEDQEEFKASDYLIGVVRKDFVVTRDVL